MEFVDPVKEGVKVEKGSVWDESVPGGVCCGWEYERAGAFLGFGLVSGGDLGFGRDNVE